MTAERSTVWTALTEEDREILFEWFPESTVGLTNYLWNQSDEDGRPLGEATSSERAREGVELETRACPYSGSRKGLPMNVSALRQVTERWETILALLLQIRSRFLGSIGTDRLTQLMLWKLAVTVTALPAFLRRGVPGSTIPASVAGLFKTGQGVGMVLEAMLLEGSHSPLDLLAPSRLSELAESLGQLVANGNACAGPPHMIDQFTIAFVDGTAGDIERETPLTSWNDARWERYLAYGDLNARAELLRASRAIACLVSAAEPVGPCGESAGELVRRWSELRPREAPVLRAWQTGESPEADAGLRGTLELLTAMANVGAPTNDRLTEPAERSLRAWLVSVSPLALDATEALALTLSRWLAYDRWYARASGSLQRQADEALGRAHGGAPRSLRSDDLRVAVPSLQQLVSALTTTRLGMEGEALVIGEA